MAVDTKPNEAPQGATTTDEKTELEALETFQKAQTDGSKVVDRKQYLGSFEEITASLTAHRDHSLGVGEASRRGAQASIALRLAVRRGDNEAPDFAGNTFAYSFAYNRHLDAFAEAQGITPEQVKKYRQAVRAYMSDHGMIRKAQALWLVQNESALAPEADAVKEAVKTDGKIPPMTLKAIRKDSAKQVGTNGKARLNGFKTEQVRNTFAPAPKTKAGGAKADPAKVTPAVAWEILRGDVAKLAPVDALDEMLHLDTALADKIIGEKGAKVPEIKNRSKVVEAYQTRIRLLTAVLAVIEQKGEKGATEEHRWSEQDSK